MSKFRCDIMSRPSGDRTPAPHNSTQSTPPTLMLELHEIRECATNIMLESHHLMERFGVAYPSPPGSGASESHFDPNIGELLRIISTNTAIALENLRTFVARMG